MKKEYLERLRELDNRRVAFYLSEEMSMERDSERSFLKAVLLSYIAYLTRKRGIDTSKVTIDELVDKISVNKNLEYSILENLRRDMDKIEDIKEEFTDDELLSFIMFSDLRKFGRFMIRDISDKNLQEVQRRILDIKEGESVIEFGSDSGEFLVDTSIENPGARCYGFEENIVTSAISMVRKEVLDADITISNKNIFELDSKEFIGNKKIISNYRRFVRSCRGKFTHEIVEKYNIKNPTRVNREWLLNFAIIDMLDEGDKAISFVSPGTTFRDVEDECRKMFVENGFIECVISLPEERLIVGPTSTPMIVLSRNNKKVRFIDATDMYEEQEGRPAIRNWNIDEIMEMYEGKKSNRVVEKTIEELRENNYNLNPLGYTSIISGDTDEVALGDIADMKRGSQIKVKELDMMKSDEETELKYITPSNIENGLVSIHNQYLKEIPNNMEKYCAKEGDIVLTKTASPSVKSAVIRIREGQQLLVTGNLFILSVDKEKINPYYLQAFLGSDLGKACIKRVCGGAVIPVVSLKELRGMKIPVPDKIRQKKIEREYKDLLGRLSRAKCRIERIENDIEKIFDTENSIIY